MLRRSKHPISPLFRLYVLGAIFLLPLSIGIVLATNNAARSDDADRFSHEIGSMFAQGLDFSQGVNRNIAVNVAGGIGIDMQAGRAVLILSKIRMVHPSDCSEVSGISCTNQGHAVVTERYVIGNPTLRTSSFGTPVSLDATSGKVRDWANDLSARVANFESSLKPGEVTYAAECYLASSDTLGGVYSRTIF